MMRKIIPSFFISFYHFLLAFLGAFFFRFPSKKIKVIGVTGTNGKTTVTEMITKILEEGKKKVALANSIRFKIGEKEEPNLLKMTMPGRFFLQKFLRKAVDAGCQYAILEVTSEGIKQHRHKFINFEAAIFTNLAPEHIEAHGGFEKYREAKGKLFQATKNIHIINLDDENSKYFLQFPSQKKILYSTNKNSFSLATQQETIVFAEKIETSEDNLSFSINSLRFNLTLKGEFNIYNALAAISLGLSQGISLEICQRALGKIEKIPGRMEEVISQPFKVFVDYAFTPNALCKVYQALENSKLKTQNSKLICVLGAAGGGRDKWKRPILGELAAKYCDEVIVTNEDPYDEDPKEIINQVAQGTKGKAKKILDRREAVGEALKLAKEKDLIIITGKGCEPWICLAGGKKIPWDDRKVVKEEFEKIKWPIKGLKERTNDSWAGRKKGGLEVR